jgi:hypothetical protein
MKLARLAARRSRRSAFWGSEAARNEGAAPEHVARFAPERASQSVTWGFVARRMRNWGRGVDQVKDPTT